MANMSYCRWENTSADMADCLEAQREGFDVSDANQYESAAYYRALKIAAKMLAEAPEEDVEQAGLDVSIVEAARSVV